MHVKSLVPVVGMTLMTLVAATPAPAAAAAVTAFGNFGQYVYQTYNPQTDSVAHDGYQFAWQGGVDYKFAKATSAKVAVGFYNYSGFGYSPQPKVARAPVHERRPQMASSASSRGANRIQSVPTRSTTA